MTDHIVTAYDNDLQGLAKQIAEMGGMSEQLVKDSVQSLIRGDTALAQELILSDKRIDDYQREIDEQSILTIVKRQPMAQDLREIISAIRISNDLERVGDLGKNIARRTLAIDGELGIKQRTKLTYGIAHMSELASLQLVNVLDAFTSRDVAKAQAVWERDDEVDTLYTSIFRELLTYMMEDQRNISMCTHLLFCAKNIERIGDHATNIAETVVYLVTGQPLSEERPKTSETSVPSK